MHLQQGHGRTFSVHHFERLWPRGGGGGAMGVDNVTRSSFGGLSGNLISKELRVCSGENVMQCNNWSGKHTQDVSVVFIHLRGSQATPSRNVIK